MRTDEALWERVKKEITGRDIMGTRAGQWSARKAQLAVKEYKKRGGRYAGKKPTDGLVKWGQEDWRTKSGLPSSVTGERYLPSKAIEALTAKQYERTSKAKRKGKGQYVKQPADIAEIVKQFR